jgi:hypothetical protein
MGTTDTQELDAMSIRFGKCPGCALTLDRVKAQPVEIELDDTDRKAAGVSYFCAGCGHLLSIQLDPYMADRRIAGVTWFRDGSGQESRRYSRRGDYGLP